MSVLRRIQPDASSTACAEEVTPLSEGVEVPPPVPIRI